ncbi:nuclease domain-containing protein [uncultured Microbulbifer sp.]|uniref:nuclease domain-containing protein n=1 Tax=uncultured Microbulbifer sp. TaxID=348147 RepID=UPI00263146AD|nr:nuclease domain-containing protein [uncultured Microbulbifer sp.]
MSNTKLRQTARGEDCTLRLYPHCNSNPETVVLCHLPSNSGLARKSPDWWGVYGCNCCHDVIDGRCKTEIPKVEIERSKLRALYETHTRMRDKGLIR